MIKFAKIHKVSLDDEREIHFKDVTIGCAAPLMAFEESGQKDMGSLCQLLLNVCVEEDGSPLKDFEGYTAEQLANALPADEAMKLFNAFGEIAQGNAEGQDG